MTKELTSQEISDLKTYVTKSLGVDNTKVDLIPIYKTSGTMKVTIPKTMKKDVFKKILEDTLSEKLSK